MKRALITIFVATTSIVGMAQAKHNVSLKLHVSPYINEVEQMVYVSHNERNEKIIDDSVKITPSQQDYSLRSYVPHEAVFKLFFSKRGPFELNILTHPNEELELEITEEDNRLSTRYKRLTRGAPENDSLVAFAEKSNSYTMKMRQFEDAMAVYGIPHERINELADSLVFYRQKRIDHWRYTALHSSSPYIALYANTCLWNNVSPEEYKSINTYNYHRFTNYPPIQWEYFNTEVAPPSEQSKRNTAFLQKIRQSRITFMQETLKADTPNIGDTLNMMLIDSIGQSVPISAYYGKYVLVEIWASWCLPCIKVMPNIMKAIDLFPEDLVCCAITIDKSVSSWKESITNNKLQNIHHFKATDDQGNMYEDMKPLAAGGAIPRNYLLDREGRIIAIDLYDEELIKKLEELTVEQK